MRSGKVGEDGRGGRGVSCSLWVGNPSMIVPLLTVNLGRSE